MKLGVKRAVVGILAQAEIWEQMKIGERGGSNNVFAGNVDIKLLSEIFFTIVNSSNSLLSSKMN